MRTERRVAALNRSDPSPRRGEMTDTRIELPGSRHSVPHDMQPVGRVPKDEPITVSVYLKDRSGDPLLEGAEAQFHSRTSLREKREQNHAEDVAAIRAF